jgi:hypothetical protein
MSSSTIELHGRLTKERVVSYDHVFGSRPIAAFPFTFFDYGYVGEDICIDVFIYEMHVKHEHIYALVTNGLSDRRMSDDTDAMNANRTELIQYVQRYSEDYAKHLHSMAWTAAFKDFRVDAGDTIASELPGVANSKWQHGFFLQPFLAEHRESGLMLAGDPLSFLWYIPISTDELEFKREHGLQTFLAVLDESELPWVFDEQTRISMV